MNYDKTCPESFDQIRAGFTVLLTGMEHDRIRPRENFRVEISRKIDYKNKRLKNSAVEGFSRIRSLNHEKRSLKTPFLRGFQIRA
jgi:hypothetical protein